MMKNFKIKMLCRLLTLAMLISLINIPTSFADNALVMQVGSNGSAVVDKLSSATVSWSKLSGVGGTLVHGSLANAYNTPYMEMNKKGTVCVDVDNNFLNNITEATFEIWVDNNNYENDRRNRYLFGLYDEKAGAEKLSVELCNGTEYDNGLGYGLYAESTNATAQYKQRGKDHTIFDDWAHVVATLETVDGVDNQGNKVQYVEYKLYMNGVYKGGNKLYNTLNEDGTFTNILSSEDMRLRIGHARVDNPVDKWFGFIGRLGDLKVYNYAMTKNEIASAYNQNKAMYINDLSNEFSIEKHTVDSATNIIDKVEAGAVTAKNGYVANPYALGGTVKVAFTAPVNKNSISEETINLVDIKGNVVPGSTSVTLSDMGYVAYITYGQLTEGAQYAVKLNGLKSVNNIVLDATSQYFTFTGGTAENAILLVRPYKGKNIEFTLNYPLSADEFDPEICEESTNFSLDDATYDEATRTITLTAQKNLVSGNEYTVGYGEVSKTFTAVADGEFVIEVPVAPEEVAPQIPIAPVEPANSLLMNLSVVGGRIVDTTGNGTVTATQIPTIGGRLNANYLANANRTPYIEFTQNGAYVIEVDSPAIEGLDNMTFDVWVKNDDRNIDTKESQQDRYNNTFFTIADATVEDETVTDPTVYKVGLHDGTNYASAGYGFTGVAKSITGADISARHYTEESSMWDEWSHLVITKEKPADDRYYYLNYYLNGEFIKKSWVEHTTQDGSVSGDVLDWNNTVLRIGHMAANTKWDKWAGFIGRISEFKVFNYAKTEADIKAQYEAQKYNYVEDLSDNFTLELVEASKNTMANYPRGAYAGGGKIKATFSAAINPDTINENSLTLVDASGNVIPGGVTVEVSEQGSVAYITYGAVAVDAEYYLKVNGLQSVNGVPLKVTSSEAITFIEGREEGLEDGILLVKPFKGNTIDITLNYALKAEDFDASKAILSAGGYDFDNTTATYDEATRTITLTAKDNFVQRGKYLFTYDGKQKNFIAEEYVEPVEPITIGTPVFKDQAGNVLTSNTVTGVTSICSDVNVVTDGMTEFVAILSVYCGGQLVDIDMLGTNNSGSVNKFTNEVTELNSAYTYTFDLEVNALDETKDYTSKLMLWDTFGNMAPYAMYVPSSN